MDATRADRAFLYEMIDTAIAAGAGIITISDDAAEKMPDEFAAFISEIAAHTGGNAEISVMCSDKNGAGFRRVGYGGKAGRRQC